MLVNLVNLVMLAACFARLSWDSFDCGQGQHWDFHDK